MSKKSWRDILANEIRMIREKESKRRAGQKISIPYRETWREENILPLIDKLLKE